MSSYVDWYSGRDVTPKVFIVVRSWGDGYGHGDKEAKVAYFNKNDATKYCEFMNSTDEGVRRGGAHWDVEEVPIAPQVTTGERI